MAGLRSPRGAEEFAQRPHVVHGVDERQRDHVRVVGNEVQVRAVLVGHRRKSQLAVGQVDALVGGELRAARAGMRNSNVETIGFLALDDAADPAVVDPDPLAGAGVLEDLG